MFGTPFILRAGEKALFGQGLSLTLKEINDSRCPKDVQCVWQGELSAFFNIALGENSGALRLGTVTKQSDIFNGYRVTLKSATTESATVIVTVVETATSGISGFIHMGPICPVERIPPDSNCADRPYANAKVVIRNTKNNIIAGQTFSDEKGKFRITLMPGTYMVEVSSPTGSPLPRCGATEQIVKTAVFTAVDVSCDSGIR
jgi:hypothetical protein